MLQKNRELLDAVVRGVGASGWIAMLAVAAGVLLAPQQPLGPSAWLVSFATTVVVASCLAIPVGVLAQVLKGERLEAWWGDPPPATGPFTQLVGLTLMGASAALVGAGVHHWAARLDSPNDVAWLAVVAWLPVAWLGNRVLLPQRMRVSSRYAWPMIALVGVWGWLSVFPVVLPNHRDEGLLAVFAGAAVALTRVGALARRAMWINSGLVLAALVVGLCLPIEAAMETVVGRHALRVMRAPTDWDGDGFGRGLGGGDCDDGNPDVNPVALELVNNGKDDNCQAGDLADIQPPAERPVAKRPAARGPNVVLLSIDTWRADHFTAQLTPNLWRFAEKGRRFEQAYSAAPHTFLSLRALHSGRVPSDFDLHGVQVGMDLTLAEQLSAAGWVTAVVHSVQTLDPLITVGFQMENRAHAGPASLRGTTAAPVVATALSFLQRPPVPGRPFLLWVHLFDPHRIYVPHAGFEHLGDDVRGLYAQEVAASDQAVASLLAFLDQPEIAEQTVVVIFSDHGEALGEHGEYAHRYTLYDEVTHVPLVVRAPGLQSGVVTTPVSLLDVYPTVGALVGLRPEEFAGDGASLLTPPPNRCLFAEGRYKSPTIAFLSVRCGDRLLHCSEFDRDCQLIPSGSAQDKAQLQERLERYVDQHRNDKVRDARHAGWLRRYQGHGSAHP
jgi:hypothetical protein